MNAGSTHRYDCADCATEFELTLEPKSKGEGEDNTVTACPFCGSLSGVTSETDEDLCDDDKDDGTPP